LFEARQRLTFAIGTKETPDFAIYTEAIETYVVREKVLDAIRLLMLSGELMMSETISFQDRNDFTLVKYRERLAKLCRLAKLERLQFLG